MVMRAKTFIFLRHKRTSTGYMIRSGFRTAASSSRARAATGSSNAFYDRILSSVRYQPGASTHSDTVIDKFKSSPTRDQIDRVSAAATFDSHVRKRCINELKSLNLQLYPHLYTGIIGGLITQEDPSLVEFHNQFFRSDCDPKLAFELALATFQYGTLRGPVTTQRMVELYDSLPKEISKGLADRLIDWWVKMNVSRHVLPLLLKMIERGDFPASKTAQRGLLVLMGDDTLDFTQAVVTASQEHDVPPSLLNKMVILASRGNDRQQRQHLQEWMGLGPHYLSEEFWKCVFQNLTNVPVREIQEAAESANCTYTPQILTQEALRSRTVEECLVLIERIKGFKVQVPDRVYGRLIYLQSKQDFKKGGGLKDTNELVSSLVTKLGPRKQLIDGLMYAYRARGKNAACTNFFHALSKTDANTPVTFNVALTSMCERYQMFSAMQVVKEMLEKNVRINDDAFAKFIISLLEYGRVVVSPRAKYISRPARTSAEEPQKPHEPFTLKYVFKTMRQLEEQGYYFPETKLPSLIERMDKMQGISFANAQRLILTMATAQIRREGNHAPMTDIEELLIRYWREHGDQKNSRFAFLTYKETLTLVRWGFTKCPKQPHRAAHLLVQLKQLGVDISRESVVRAYSELFRLIYGHVPVKGELRRVRSQIDTTMTLDDVIEKVNRAWNSQLHCTKNPKKQPWFAERPRQG